MSLIDSQRIDFERPMTSMLSRHIHKAGSGLRTFFRRAAHDSGSWQIEEAEANPKNIARNAIGNMPVMILGDHFGYPGNVVHGVTIYYLNVIPALVAAGITVHACFLREPHPAADALKEQGVEPVFFSASKWNPLVAFRLAAYMRRHKCSIVHACGMKAALMARIAARLVGSKVIVHVHDQLYPNFLVRAAYRFLARNSDVGIGVSGAAIDVVTNGYHIDPEHSRVIHNGLPLQNITSVNPASRSGIRTELGISENALAIAVIARMHPIKGHRSMLAVMARIVKERPDAVLVLAGDGPERAACEALAKELGISANVRFLGSRSDVPELMAASDVVAVPSKSEGLSLVAIEACAAGRPVVAFDAGGIGDVVSQGATGYLVPPGDEAAFANAILDLASNPGKCAQFGERGKIEAQRFTIENHIRRLLMCYLEVAGSTSRSS